MSIAIHISQSYLRVAIAHRNAGYVWKITGAISECNPNKIIEVADHRIKTAVAVDVGQESPRCCVKGTVFDYHYSRCKRSVPLIYVNLRTYAIYPRKGSSPARISNQQIGQAIVVNIAGDDAARGAQKA